MAEELLAAHKSGKVRTIQARASYFFGPRNPELPHSYSYMADIGKALVILGERDEALGQAWHIPNPKTVTTRQFIEMIYAELGQPAKIQVPPKLILRLIALFNGNLREVLEMLYQFEEPFIVDHSKFEQAFGNHATPLDEAIRQTVAWYRERQ
jgi:nucleoside-diphosphate-sugar epimerase